MRSACNLKRAIWSSIAHTSEEKERGEVETDNSQDDRRVLRQRKFRPEGEGEREDK